MDKDIAQNTTQEQKIETQEPTNTSANNVKSKSRLTKLKDVVVLVAGVMISAGQWGDTKELFISLYEDGIAHFTHQIEYDAINQINVGNSMFYVESLICEPHKNKSSKKNPKILYSYYTNPKYNLTLISLGNRLVGYTVIPLVSDFEPLIPFSEVLGSSTLAKTHLEPKNYYFDRSNLLYYLEPEELPKQNMFLTVIRGFIEYGKLSDEVTNNKSNIETLLVAVEREEMIGDDNKKLNKLIKSLRESITPNFYAITELDSSLIAESLLTRYEYKLYNNS